MQLLMDNYGWVGLCEMSICRYADQCRFRRSPLLRGLAAAPTKSVENASG
jgi:hypothetical protein